jgi:DNA-directed RNA polymerase-3 subunit RPC5
LRGLALAKTMLPKGGSKIDVDAANSLDVPQDELKAVLGEVACDIHGCFVLKSSKDDLFRFSLSLLLLYSRRKIKIIILCSTTRVQRVFRKVTHSICNFAYNTCGDIVPSLQRCCN